MDSEARRERRGSPEKEAIVKQGSMMGFLVAVLIGLILSEAWSYEIGVGDVLDIDMWQQPELSTTVRVYGDGTVALPVVGTVKVEGMTPAQAAELISRKLSVFNPRISQVAVKIVEFNAQSVFVLGEVRSPGRYGFETIPDLVTVLSEAGGTTEEATLSEVLILRKHPSESRGVTVDVEGIVNEKNLSLLPPLKPGDLIWVPGRGSRVGRNRVSVVGEVHSPGTYAIGSGTDLFDLILLAGGPTEEADLGRVKVLQSTGKAFVINVDSYLVRGERSKMMRLNPDDIVIVGRRSKFWSTVWNGFREVVTVLGAVASLYLIYNTLTE